MCEVGEEGEKDLERKMKRSFAVDLGHRVLESSAVEVGVPERVHSGVKQKHEQDSICCSKEG